jgi:hypothetical protein
MVTRRALRIALHRLERSPLPPHEKLDLEWELLLRMHYPLPDPAPSCPRARNQALIKRARG